jgi:hypothetical protein
MKVAKDQQKPLGDDLSILFYLFEKKEQLLI